ncbi:maleylpyruvate isomerase N-terminal domain-containing protein [Streptomyces sp. NA04227]|uniref:maleylpyruvate isomerase N-terminal domain-containing protein n=1 Tax=Streptomyces sp. NA04227 TaxID=2742136 RepID=UPI0015915DF2|nr:maleylpyruvate isomerase N-terminal domain-containing protein [Streptomyces sp. NA04227]QKW08764.1 maleylpyruvate isomerase N-terminal domain-containing protein [Streptomyces sp. NA04227]
MTDTGTSDPRRNVVVEVDLAALRAALEREAHRVRGLARTARTLSAPVPGLEWDTGKLLTHLVMVYRAFAIAVRGEDFEAALEEAKQSALLRLTGRLDKVIGQINDVMAELVVFENADEAADALEQEATALCTALAAETDPHRRVSTPWYGEGATRTVATAAALALNETLLHGIDLARAVGAAETVPHDAAALAAPLVMSEMLPELLDLDAAEGFKGHFGVALRGSQRFVVSVAEGRAWSSRWEEQRRDCVMSMRPGTALLLGMRRIPLWRAMATGGVVSYGRMPWKAMQFPKLFVSA